MRRCKIDKSTLFNALHSLYNTHSYTNIVNMSHLWQQTNAVCVSASGFLCSRLPVQLKPFAAARLHGLVFRYLSDFYACVVSAFVIVL